MSVLYVHQWNLTYGNERAWSVCVLGDYSNPILWSVFPPFWRPNYLFQAPFWILYLRTLRNLFWGALALRLNQLSIRSNCWIWRGWSCSLCTHARSSHDTGRARGRLYFCHSLSRPCDMVADKLWRTRNTQQFLIYLCMIHTVHFTQQKIERIRIDLMTTTGEQALRERKRERWY